MDLTFLGTCSAVPSLTRNVSSLAFRNDGDVWLFDCGEGTQQQLHKLAHKPHETGVLTEGAVRLTKITKVFITHLHGDHLWGLPGLLCTICNLNGKSTDDDPSDESTEYTPLEGLVEVYGPPGLRNYLKTCVGVNYPAWFGFRVHELRHPDQPDSLTHEQDPRHYGADIISESVDDAEFPSAPQPNHDAETFIPEPDFDNPQPSDRIWRLGKYGNLALYAAPLQHTLRTHSVGYFVVEDDLPGKLDPSLAVPHLVRNKEALKKQGITSHMSLLKNVKAGEIVELPDGTVLDPANCVGPAQPGRRVGILGDVCKVPDSMLRLLWGNGKGCDCLVHEATNACLCSDLEGKDESAQQQTRVGIATTTCSHGHSTPEMAGAVAKRVGAKQLILNHFSHRYKGDASEESLSVMEEIRQCACKVFGSNNVITARDFSNIKINRQ